MKFAVSTDPSCGGLRRARRGADIGDRSTALVHHVARRSRDGWRAARQMWHRRACSFIVLYACASTAGENPTSMAACKPALQYLSLPRVTTHAVRRRRLILVPDSGWGDFTHALTTAFVAGATFGVGTQVLETDWGCGLMAITSHAHGSKYSWRVSSAALQRKHPSWPAIEALLPLARYHKFPARLYGGYHWVVQDGNECVELQSAWEHQNGHHISTLVNRSSCRILVVMGANWQDPTLLGHVAAKLRMSSHALRSCILRYLITFQTRVTDAARLAVAGDVRGDARVVRVGIHVRGLRFLRSRSANVTGRDDAELDPQHRSRDWNPAAFQLYADAARGLISWWQSRHPRESARFEWLVVADSDSLRSTLQRAWAPHARNFTVGSPLHIQVGKPSAQGESSSECDATYTEWLLLSQCELLVVSPSGFSIAAATYSETIEHVALIGWKPFKGFHPLQGHGVASYTLSSPDEIPWDFHPASFTGFV